MGHLIGKDLYKSLGKKLDNLPYRVNCTETFHQILKKLFTEEEADVAIQMPYVLSTIDIVARDTGLEIPRLQKILDGMCSKGLVLDLWIEGQYYYLLSPLIVGVFEFTMMRAGKDIDSKEMAYLFEKYYDEDGFLGVNYGDSQQFGPLRTFPHENTIAVSEYAEILDYEKATEIIKQSDKFAIGLCSCRHEKLHTGKKACDVPLETCVSLSFGADFVIRNNLGKKVSQSEMIDNIALSRDMGLVIIGDNVQNNVTFLCQCCGCCCNVLRGISVMGYPHTVVTSSYIAEVDQNNCNGCGKCAKACPINAIQMVPIDDQELNKKRKPNINTNICIGCGVCALKCAQTGSLKLVKREKRVIHPETTFERIILQSLERGTLEHQIFNNPKNMSQKIIKAFIGGFLRLEPVKRALLSDKLRSSFLAAMKLGLTKQGKAWMLDI